MDLEEDLLLKTNTRDGFLVVVQDGLDVGGRIVGMDRWIDPFFSIDVDGTVDGEGRRDAFQSEDGGTGSVAGAALLGPAGGSLAAPSAGWRSA